MVGRRLREIRSWRGLSLTVTAELAGLSAGYLSHIERGLRPLQRRATLEALASALRVAPSEITGQPYPPSSASDAVAYSAAPALRAVLHNIELGEPSTGASQRPLGELHAEVSGVNAACAACDYSVLGDTVPRLLGELHTQAELEDSTQARRLLAETLHVAFYLAKDLGHGDLGWMVAGHLHAAAAALGDPTWGALADFVRAHAVVGLRARERGLALVECTGPDVPDRLQVNGRQLGTAAVAYPSDPAR
jgi:transcriptional regulator with XRE-family HTH domain